MIIKSELNPDFTLTYKADSDAGQTYMEKMAARLKQGGMPERGDFNADIIVGVLQKAGEPGEFAFLEPMNEFDRWDWLHSCFRKFMVLQRKGYEGTGEVDTLVDIIRLVRKWRKENKAAHPSKRLNLNEGA